LNDQPGEVQGWRRKAALVTGDPEFKPLEPEIKINWLK
jgi:hypothetical protein